MEFQIIDSHVHFQVAGYEPVSTREKYIREFGAEKWRRLQQKNAYQKQCWRAAWQFPEAEPPANDYIQTAQRWLQEMEKHHIAKMVFVTGGGNEALSKVVTLAPDRFIGYAHHNLFLVDAAVRLEAAIRDLGFKGYKILAPDLPGRIDDPSLRPVWEVAEQYRIPVLIHFGILGAAGGIASHCNINPMILHDVARGYPDIPFIIPHFGCGHPEELLQLAWVCPNVYVDTSGSNQWTRWMPYPLTVRDLLRKYYETVGPERIIFGTDSEWFPRGFVRRYYEEQLRDCVELGMKPAEIKGIFRDNIAGLLEI
jgi:predicted TIM-barrel fold metal-dependent hydrolase